ncbi:MAG: hypothetical protein CYPHOPRED_003228 [Cyphobasidiales sp. Tagirdzhanova-0007]|nr:MAG: hypothetical protein CYPHOPRED_003228 [Cyphobasidiales sp. Tagirdzhanova-0007]
MARGLQKVQSQQKNAAAAGKKGGSSTLKAYGQGLEGEENFCRLIQPEAKTPGFLVEQYKCPKCMLDIDSLSNVKQHFTSKHPKDPEPDYDNCKKTEAAAKS